MRHLLHDPHFPDLIAALVAEQSDDRARDCANDNDTCEPAEPEDAVIDALARLEVAATRAW